MTPSAKSHCQAFLITVLAIAPAFPLSCLSEKGSALAPRNPCEVPGVTPTPGTASLQLGDRREVGR